jgi:hypothetical protein
LVEIHFNGLNSHLFNKLKNKKIIMADEEKKIEEQDIAENEDGENESENEAFGKSELNCRFYGNEFPEVEDLVMVSFANMF